MILILGNQQISKLDLTDSFSECSNFYVLNVNCDFKTWQKRLLVLAAVYMQIGHLEIPPCEIEIPKPSYSHVDRMFLNDMKGRCLFLIL